MNEVLTLLSLFGGCFLAATVLPFSSEIIFATAIHYSNINPVTLVLIAGLGNTLGGLTGYLLGSFGKTIWLKKYLRISEISIKKTEHKVQKYGYWLSLFCWLPFVGDLFCVALGYFKSPLLPNAILMFVGKVSRYAVLAYLLVK